MNFPKTASKQSHGTVRVTVEIKTTIVTVTHPTYCCQRDLEIFTKIKRAFIPYFFVSPSVCKVSFVPLQRNETILLTRQSFETFSDNCTNLYTQSESWNSYFCIMQLSLKTTLQDNLTKQLQKRQWIITTEWVINIKSCGYLNDLCITDCSRQRYSYLVAFSIF